jgi:hypothetical protein
MWYRRRVFCELLESLVRSRFLRRKSNGKYVRASADWKLIYPLSGVVPVFFGAPSGIVQSTRGGARMRGSRDWPADYDDAEGNDSVTALAKRMLTESVEQPEIEWITTESLYASEPPEDDDDLEPTI